MHAALAGKVVFVKQDSDVGGPSKRKYWYLGNRVVIEHRNEEYTAYEHLRYLGSCVSEGQRVRTGQLIGYSGNTGYTYEPHLHFEVFVRPGRDKSEGSTIVPRFKNRPKQTWVRIRKAERRQGTGDARDHEEPGDGLYRNLRQGAPYGARGRVPGENGEEVHTT